MCECWMKSMDKSAASCNTQGQTTHIVPLELFYWSNTPATFCDLKSKKKKPDCIQNQNLSENFNQ